MTGEERDQLLSKFREAVRARDIDTVSPWELTFERQCLNCVCLTEQIQVVNHLSKPLFWNCLWCGYPNPLDAPTT